MTDVQPQVAPPVVSLVEKPVDSSHCPRRGCGEEPTDSAEVRGCAWGCEVELCPPDPLAFGQLLGTRHLR